MPAHTQVPKSGAPQRYVSSAGEQLMTSTHYQDTAKLKTLRYQPLSITCEGCPSNLPAAQRRLASDASSRLEQTFNTFSSTRRRLSAPVSCPVDVDAFCMGKHRVMLADPCTKRCYIGENAQRPMATSSMQRCLTHAVAIHARLVFVLNCGKRWLVC